MQYLRQFCNISVNFAIFPSILQYLRQFCNISVNFEVTKMVEPLWKSQDQAFSILDVWGGTLQYVWRVFLKKCRMDQRRYKSRHWIPMFIIYIQPWPENCGIGRRHYRISEVNLMWFKAYSFTWKLLNYLLSQMCLFTMYNRCVSCSMRY